MAYMEKIKFKTSRPYFIDTLQEDCAYVSLKLRERAHHKNCNDITACPISCMIDGKSGVCLDTATMDTAILYTLAEDIDDIAMKLIDIQSPFYSCYAHMMYERLNKLESVVCTVSYAMDYLMTLQESNWPIDTNSKVLQYACKTLAPSLTILLSTICSYRLQLEDYEKY